MPSKITEQSWHELIGTEAAISGPIWIFIEFSKYIVYLYIVLLWGSWMCKCDFWLLGLLLGLGSLLLLCWVSLSNFVMMGYFCLFVCFILLLFLWETKKNMNLQRMNLGAWPTMWTVQRENDSMIQCINLRRQCWHNLVITLFKSKVH